MVVKSNLCNSSCVLELGQIPPIENSKVPVCVYEYISVSTQGCSCI